MLNSFSHTSRNLKYAVNIQMVSASGWPFFLLRSPQNHLSTILLLFLAAALRALVFFGLFTRKNAWRCTPPPHPSSLLRWSYRNIENTAKEFKNLKSLRRNKMAPFGFPKTGVLAFSSPLRRCRRVLTFSAHIGIRYSWSSQRVFQFSEHLWVFF